MNIDAVHCVSGQEVDPIFTHWNICMLDCIWTRFQGGEQYQSDLENNPGINTKTAQRLNSKEPIQQ